jgi:hypothetical protein
MAACNRVTLNDERTVEVPIDTFKMINLDAVKRDQKVKVEVSSPGAAVSVYVVLEKDRATVQQALEVDKRSDKILASTEKTESATLEANIPAGNAAVILLMSACGKTANVKVKSTN